MARQDDGQVAIAAAGGIAPLIEMTRSGNASETEKAAMALRNLAANKDNAVLIASAGGIAPLIELMRSGTVGAKEQAMEALANLAIDNADNKAAIMAARSV